MRTVKRNDPSLAALLVVGVLLPLALLLVLGYWLWKVHG